MEIENLNVRITVEEYLNLQLNQEKLNRLEAGGVDNWEGYEDSLNLPSDSLKDYEISNKEKLIESGKIEIISFDFIQRIKNNIKPMKTELIQLEFNKENKKLIFSFLENEDITSKKMYFYLIQIIMNVINGFIEMFDTTIQINFVRKNNSGGYSVIEER